MKRALSLGAMCGLGISFGLPFAVVGQEKPKDQGGISSPLLSRCAGRFGADLRAGDQAFPLLSLLGVPWFTIERTDETLDGAHIVAIVTGFGGRSRRRGEVVELRYRCLIDDKGAAVSFRASDLIADRSQALPPTIRVRGAAYYRPKTQLPPGAELRVQLFDRALDAPQLLTEAVVRSSWIDPIPFGLRLPTELKLAGRKLAVSARIAVGSQTLFRLKEPQPLTADGLEQAIDLTLQAVTGVDVD